MSETVLPPAWHDSATAVNDESNTFSDKALDELGGLLGEPDEPFSDSEEDFEDSESSSDEEDKEDPTGSKTKLLRKKKSRSRHLFDS